MKTEANYGQLKSRLAQLTARLDHMLLGDPPNQRRSLEDALLPVKERLLALADKGWTVAQLVEAVAGIRVAIKPRTLSRCLSKWKAARPEKNAFARAERQKLDRAGKRVSADDRQRARDRQNDDWDRKRITAYSKQLKSRKGPAKGL